MVDYQLLIYQSHELNFEFTNVLNTKLLSFVFYNISKINFERKIC